MSKPTSTPFATHALPAHYDHLAPDGSEIRLLGQTAAGNMTHCTLPAGEISQAVAHRTVEEIWYCLGGSGAIWRSGAGGEAITELRPGVSVTIPLGTRFQFRSGAAPLQLLIVTIPPWPGAGEAVPVAGAWDAERASASEPAPSELAA